MVDSSVACKWFAPEKHSAQALELLGAHIDGRLRLVAPDLICYEVLNALRYHPGLSSADVKNSPRYLLDLQLTLIRPTVAMLELAADFAIREGVTIYDACYAALAESRDCILVTDDKLLLKSSRRAAPISDWSLSG